MPEAMRAGTPADYQIHPMPDSFWINMIMDLEYMTYNNER